VTTTQVIHLSGRNAQQVALTTALNNTIMS